MCWRVIAHNKGASDGMIMRGEIKLVSAGCRYIFARDFSFKLIANVMQIMVYCRWERCGGEKNYISPQETFEKL